MAKQLKKSDLADKGKLLIAAPDLKRALGFIGGAVKDNPAYPILSYIRIVTKPNAVVFISSDLTTTLFFQVPAMLSGLEFVNFLVPFAELATLANGFGSDQVVFCPSFDGELLHVINYDKGCYKLNGQNVVDFPKLKPFKEETKLTFQGAEKAAIIEAFEGATEFVNKDDLSPALSGVNIQIVGDMMQIQASNFHTLRLQRENIGFELETPYACIVREKLARQIVEIGKMFPNDALEFHALKNSVKVVCKSAVIQSQLVDEIYPDTAKAIPTDNPLKISVAAADVNSALTRISSVWNKTTNQLRFLCSENTLTISAENLDYGQTGDEVLTAEYDGPDFEFGFNGNYLRKVLSNVSGPTYTFTMSEPNRAVLIYGQNLDVTTLIMPVSLLPRQI